MGEFFDAEDAQQIRYMLDGMGSACTVIVDEGTVLKDATQPWLGNTAIEGSYPGIAVVVSVSRKDRENAEVKKTDRKAYFAPASIAVEPKRGDRFVQGGVRYSIVEANPAKPGDTALCWRLIIRN